MLAGRLLVMILPRSVCEACGSAGEQRHVEASWAEARLRLQFYPDARSGRISAIPAAAGEAYSFETDAFPHDVRSFYTREFEARGWLAELREAALPSSVLRAEISRQQLAPGQEPVTWLDLAAKREGRVTAVNIRYSSFTLVDFEGWSR